MGSTVSPIDVAIIGAGIGGLALAIGLIKQDVLFTIYEAAAEFSAVGAGVGLGPNALRAIDMIDARFRKQYEGASTGNRTSEMQNVMFNICLAEEGFGEEKGWIDIPVGSPTYNRTSAHRKALLEI
jgi:salicylate hydroxylase